MRAKFFFIVLFFNVFFLYSGNEFHFEILKKAEKKIKFSNPTFQIIIKSDTFDFIKNTNGNYSIIDRYDKFKYFAETVEYADTAIRNCKLLIFTNRFVFVFKIDLFEMCKICNNTIRIVDIEKIRKKSFNYLIRYCNYFYYSIDGIKYRKK